MEKIFEEALEAAGNDWHDEYVDIAKNNEG